MTNFIRKIAPYAVEHGARAGVLPSLIIAQGILESAHGTSELAVNARNLFGIKTGVGWQGGVYRKKTAEYVNGKRVEVMADFRAYPTYEGAVIDLVAKYTSMARYAAVPFSRDYKAATQAVFAAGYATDPQYPAKLNRIIEQYGLTKYDEGVAKRLAIKIALDAGHGMNTPGKRTPDGEREWSFNNKVLLAAWRKLERVPGVQLYRTDDHTGRTDVSLAERVRRANAWGADVFVSLHHNAMSGKWHSGGGTEVYASNGASAKSVQLANSIAPKISRAMGLQNRGVKRANFYVIRYTKMPSVLVEGGFMDSRVDIVAMRNDAKLRAQGEAVADAIIEVFGLKAPVHASAPAPSQEMDYGDYLYGQTIMEGMGGAAAKRMQGDLTKLGYPLVSDGSVGPATVAAIRAFQKAHGLSVDGIAGKATQAKMRAALADLNKPKPAPNPKAPEVAQVSAQVRNEPLPSHAEGWAWAEAMGLMNGERPADTLSREQFATVLKRFYDLLYGWDRAVSATHAEAFAKAERAGIIKGGRPAAVVSREQMATILDRIGALDK